MSDKVRLRHLIPKTSKKNNIYDPNAFANDYDLYDKTHSNNISEKLNERNNSYNKGNENDKDIDIKTDNLIPNNKYNVKNESLNARKILEKVMQNVEGKQQTLKKLHINLIYLLNFY